MADFLAIEAERADQLHLERQASGQIPFLIVFHRAAIQCTPLEIGDVGEQDDLSEGFLIAGGGCGGGNALGAGSILDDLVFVIAHHDVEVAGAPLHSGEPDRLCGALLTAPREGKRDVLEREVGEVLRAGIGTREFQPGVAGKRRQAVFHEIEKRLVQHLLVLRLHHRVAEDERGVGGGENHAREEGDQQQRDDELQQCEGAL